MNINEAVKKAHSIAKSKGFWDDGRTFAETCMLIVTEISEAVQEDRKSHRGKMAGEIADATIRIFDLAGSLGIDLEEEIRKKMEINQKREYKHNRRY